MKCEYYESCPNEATVKLLFAPLEDEQDVSTSNNYCDEHAEIVKKTRVVNKEVNLSDAGHSEYIIGSTAAETSEFKDTLQDLKTESSQE